MPDPTRPVAVIGGGTMGTGIVYVAAYGGYDVTVVEPDDARAAVLSAAIDDAVTSAVGRGKLTQTSAAALVARIRRVASIKDVPARPLVAIETVPEHLDLKRRVLADIEALEPGFIGSNTSSLGIDEMSAALRRPERFLGTHFFQPVWSFKFMELIRGSATDEATVTAAVAFAKALDKESIVVRDVPGFATSRLDMISALEAMRMLEDGVTDVVDIDRASVLAFHHPIGPLRLSDMVGLDVRLDIARSLEARYGERYAPPKILIEKVARGELGRKSGQGFYAWPAQGT
jgi:3-hydroxybutyryl-CoA dehydrogenase